MDYSVLAKSYNTLQYEHQLRVILSTFYKSSSFDSLAKFDLHKIVNDSLLNHYQGEETLKFRIADFFRQNDYVAAFEVKANNSRADFLVVNGDTKCFEIKSKNDSLKRLPKQAKDYGDVFEFNTVVTDLKHVDLVEKITLPHYGIWYFDGEKRIIHRGATLSPCLAPESQLSLMTKSELKNAFGLTDKIQILSDNDAGFINNSLKDVLKARYTKRWSFLCANWDQILPIDLQFFFNSNISPELVYR